jgi:hypothetical protein
MCFMHAIQAVAEAIRLMQYGSDLAASEFECAGCGIAAMEPQAFQRVFCPDCSREHAFCGACADDAVELLAA